MLPPTSKRIFDSIRVGSMRAQMRGIAAGFQIIYAFLWISCNFFIQSEILKELLDQLTSYWPNQFVFISYPWIPLNVLQNQGFLKIFKKFQKNRYFCEISQKKPKKCNDSKTIKNVEILIAAFPTAIKSSTNKSWWFFSKKFPERLTIFFLI